MQRGATAIIFDTTDHPEAATEVSNINILNELSLTHLCSIG